MNPYLELQIRNMLMFLDSFEASCEMNASKDNRKTDKAETRQIAKVKAAAKRFRRDLQKLK